MSEGRKYLPNTIWWEPQDYTDLYKISVLILCNLMVLYVDIHTILSKYVDCTDFVNPIVFMSNL